MDLLTKYKITDLITKNFDDIKNNSTNSTIYSWKNIKHLFNDLLLNITNSNSHQEFIFNYYLFQIIYIIYSNYILYFDHPDKNNLDIINLYKKFRYDPKINSYICNNKSNQKILNIMLTKNIFIYNYLKKTNKINIPEMIKSIKNYDKIMDYPANSYKKILNLIIYRFLYSETNNKDTYHHFFIDNIITKKLSDSDKNFISKIPSFKNLFLLNYNNTTKKFSYHINNIIQSIISPNPNLIFNHHNMTITHKKNNAKIIFIHNDSENISYNIHQQNLNLFYFNIPEISNLSFVKKLNNLITVKFNNHHIHSLEELIQLIHIITCSIKYLDYQPTSIDEIYNIASYDNYFYDTFFNFFKFIKKDIFINSYQSFIFNLIKNIYLHAYFDFYIYNNKTLLTTIIQNLNKKTEIFTEFSNSIHSLFNLSDDFLSYPPFIPHNDDLDNPLHYSFDIPNYFKFIDLVNVILSTFNSNSNLSNISNLLSTFNDIFNDNFNLNKIPKTENINKNNKTENINKNENINKINKTENNLYEELNVENSENYILNTIK